MTSTAPSPLRDHDEIMRASGGDPLVVWAAQDLRPEVRAWSAGRALAVASPRLPNHDRLVLHGPPEEVAALLETVLPLVGPSYRLLGPAALVTALVARLPSLELSGEFAWMEARHDGAGVRHPPTSPPSPAPSPSPSPTVAWLDDSAAPEVLEVITAGFPESLARPGEPGVRRWAGARCDGRLAAVAAEAWSCSTVGFVSGVATRPEHRGRGLGRAVFEFVLTELLADHPFVGLFVDRSNDPAIALYRSLGMALRPVAAARQAGAGAGGGRR